MKTLTKRPSGSVNPSSHARIPFRILVVDPDLGIRTMARNALLAYPWNERDSFNEITDVDTAGSIEEAACIIRHVGPDAVLATVRTPHTLTVDPLPAIFPREKTGALVLRPEARLEIEELKRSSWNGCSLFALCVQERIPLFSFFWDKHINDSYSKSIVESFEALFPDMNEGTRFGSTLYIKGGERGDFTSFLDKIIERGGVPDIVYNFNMRKIRERLFNAPKSAKEH